jgi:exosortase/archaeosortase family protein
MTSDDSRLTAPKRIVFLAALLLAGVWLAANLTRLAGGPGGATSITLGSLFALLLAARPKPRGEREIALPGRWLAGLAVAGMLGVVIGIVVPVHQFEWLGVLLVLFACLAWSLPARYGRDVALGLFILYWIHPLPGQVFGPLQLGMQQVSVKLSEYLLQIFNMRVWGDGLFLRAGVRVFGVPEACSGVKTATTVFFCGLGVALLMRFRWAMVAILLGLGMVQVILLNVLRISGIVWFGADKPLDWNADKVLHDTMGIFMIIGVVLIYLDAVLLRQAGQWRERRRILREINDDVGEWEEKLKRWPLFWRLILLGWRPVLAVAVVGSVTAVAVLRLRPFHRAEMIRGVAETLIRTDLATAERAVKAGLAIDPRNAALQTAMATVLFERRRLDEALAYLRRRPVEARSIEDRVLEARILLDLERHDEARATMESLPPETRDWPGVAMAMAEFLAVIDRPDEVSPWLVKASYGIGLTDRLRRLFPYLAARELWETIAKVDPAMPYANPLHGVIGASARLRMNNIDGAAEVLRRGMVREDVDRLFLTPLVAVWVAKRESEWESRLEGVLRRHLNAFTAAELSEILEGAFKVGRADLGWLAYTRLRSAFGGDPDLVIAPAQFGAAWFTFRQQYLGLAVQGAGGGVDARHFLVAVGNLPPWRQLWGAIPAAVELQTPPGSAERQGRLREGLAVLEALHREGRLEPRMESVYVQILGELGRWEEAHRRLDEFEQRHPARRRVYRLQHASLYRVQGMMEPAYEAFTDYLRADSYPPLAVWMDLVNVVLTLDMGPYAMGLLDDAARLFPASDDLLQLTALTLGYFGLAEEALHKLNQMKVPADPSLRLRYLMATGRIKEGDKLAGTERLTALQFPRRQTELLMPAEWVIQWRGGVLAEDDYERERQALPPRQTGFLARLRELKDAWYRQRGGGTTSDPAAWEAAGRDDRERAAALNELTLLLARQPGRQPEALAVAGRAVALRPGWVALRRLHVALSGGDPALVEQAFKACPWDGYLWLAALIVQAQSNQAPAGVAAMIDQSIAARDRSPGTLVMASDFLLRRGLVEPAAAAAREAIARGQGLLPAYVMGLACAVKTGDVAWATRCAREGADQALDPWVFYKVMVGLKSQDSKPDADLIQALAGLQARYPDEGVWGERLGDAYFRRGQPSQAISVLEDSLRRAGSKEPPRIRTYLIASEAARLEGNAAKAIRILEAARKDYPDDPNVLNNLVYALAQSPATVGQAAALLSELLEKGGGSFAVYDTAAVVALKSGDLKAAGAYAAQAVERVKKGDYAWHEVYLNAAETQIELGRYREARQNLDVVRKSPERSQATEARVRDLLSEIVRRERD